MTDDLTVSRKSKRVRHLEVLIALQELFVERADEFERRSYKQRLDELKFEYRTRTGHDYFPPVRIDEGVTAIPYGNN